MCTLIECHRQCYLPGSTVYMSAEAVTMPGYLDSHGRYNFNYTSLNAGTRLVPMRWCC